MNLIYKEECYKIVGACFEVHKELGCGFFLEPVYQEALKYEFEKQEIPFLKETKIEISYKGKNLGKFYQADFICFNKIIVELKALDTLDSNHDAQVMNYLKATSLKLGIY